MCADLMRSYCARNRTSTKMDRLKEQLEVLKMEDLTKHEVEILDQAGATQHYRHFVSSDGFFAFRPKDFWLMSPRLDL